VTARGGLYRRAGKRLLDVLLGGAALIVASPVLLVVALALMLTQGRPVFFLQARPGRAGRLFDIVKFRTMRAAASRAPAQLPDEARLTGVGRFLRRTSLDELPELFNVVRGDMSLVGPRPLLPEYLPLYSAEQSRRHDVRPGMTGWAQVNGRNALRWEEKFQLDVWYVDRVSFALDMKILALTAWAVLRGAGISAQGHATMPRFTGSSDGGS
jgi:lipopolysaccharide/colanic/teichoic acid biosynthesis glycosyltransferase